MSLTGPDGSRRFRRSPRRYLPILDWGRRYDRALFGADLLAAVIVTIMLIPQSLAYALLAGLPAETGLYASTLPLLLYTFFGTSRTLAVGPVAVVSLMTAAAVGNLGETGVSPVAAAAILALLSGLMLLAMGLARLGFLASFLSHPVISGFITASGILIAGSQLQNLLGIKAGGQTLPDLATALATHLSGTRLDAVLIGFGTLGFLLWARRGLGPLLKRRGVAPGLAAVLVRAAPVLAIALTTFISWHLGLAERGLAVVGTIPAGLPALSLPGFDAAIWLKLATPALMISIIGYVETVSIAQTLAARRRERIDHDQELVALGASNLGAAMVGGFPVTGGFARSVVNFDSGARTPAAGALTAIGMALATLALTGLLYHLPQATLAATIVIAVLSLVDLSALPRTWTYSRADGLTMAVTVLITLGFGVEKGIATGVILSLATHLYRTSRPHVAVVGQVPGTEHFRNVDRHHVVTAPDVLSIRIDESLYFPNARFLEETLYAQVSSHPEIRDVVLMCPAVNAIDASALEALEAVNDQLLSSGVRLHLSEVKGPVMDRLRRSHLLDNLGGKVFLTHADAMAALAPDLTAKTRAEPRCETARDERGLC
ncbi:SulP family inorganic anion transporter [Paracoccus aminophilus]|uniref:Sulfate transporter, permease protein n=1 Tax=Paracoccus aminophilus JCM 7686 TaxID=1367847 RepID=S5XYT9_PARAH|nr:sulfate permease [Paracoccus aminophilus]AGT08600.1 sulfate transporter, permease protein [Paracoccus aminophilus JCM 7686]